LDGAVEQGGGHGTALENILAEAYGFPEIFYDPKTALSIGETDGEAHAVRSYINGSERRHKASSAGL
jgi:hypothetical protein